MEEFVRQVPAADILVNNLGIFEPKPFEEISDAEWFRFFETTVMSGVRLSRACLAGMREKGWGRIVFVSSESALRSPAERIHYGMRKTAQIAVGRGLAETCAGTGVTVNAAVLPGPTASEGVKDFVGSLAEQNKQTPEQFEKEFFKSSLRLRSCNALRSRRKSRRWWPTYAARSLLRRRALRCAWMGVW